MSGSLRQRTAGSWEVKFEVGVDPATGKRKTVYRTVKGTKRQAEAKLIELQSEAARGALVDFSRETVGRIPGAMGSRLGRQQRLRKDPLAMAAID